MKRNLLLTIVLFAFPLMYSSALAQMFSVGEVPRQRVLPTSFVRVGIGPAAFEYKGNNLNPLGSTLLEFDNTVLFVNVETPGVNLALILGNSATGMDDINYFDLGLTLSNKFLILRKKSISAGIPLELLSSINSINNDRSEENFNQVNFAVGVGGFFNFNLGQKLTFTNQLTPGYGFSNSNGGFFGGSLFYATGKSRLNFINLIGNRSISLGYDFNYRSFDIDGELYDFELKSHLITLGISL